MAVLASSAVTARRQASASPTMSWGSLTVSVGDIIVVLSSHDTSSSDTIPTDNLSNTYAFQGAAFTDSFFDIHRVSTARVTTAGTLTTTTFHLPGTPSAGGFAGIILTGRATTSWVNTLTSAEQATPTGADAVTVAAHTATSGDDMVFFNADLGGTQGVFTAGTNFTEQTETPTTTPGVDFDIAVNTRLNLSAGSVTPVGTNTNASRTVSFAITIKAGSSGPVDKSDSDTGTATDRNIGIAVGTPTDTATLTERITSIALAGPSDSAFFGEEQVLSRFELERFTESILRVEV